MRSDLPKPLHSVVGKSMLGHILTAVSEASIAPVAIVVPRSSPTGENPVEMEARNWLEELEFFQQTERLGTAHAVLTAKAFLEAHTDADVVILTGDAPMITPESLRRLIEPLDKGFAVAVMGFEARDPRGYGRLIVENDELTAIREDKDASAEERKITLCNGGFWAFRGDSALKILQKISNRNIKNEYYLTDAVQIARSMQLRTAVVVADETEVCGVNDRAQLAEVETLMQNRLRRKAMLGGVTMIDPTTVYLSWDTQIGRNVVIEPNVYIGTNVVIADNVVIRAFCHLSDAHVLEYTAIGPFARLRGRAVVEANAKVGNFVELKNTVLGEGVKANHLSYLGDATIGARTNIGAGTITCNYDGWKKYRTVIGEGAFIGSNSALVAPITIGAGAYVGSGSTLTDDVPEDALAIARERQVVYDGWAAMERAKRQSGKK
jgi:bifunctional UDP-N-acetylglucosamine pyrophosphorylase/glucosamine-1-phosphate N-acetyltransferase